MQKKWNRFLKRALACLLVVVMTLTAAPLSGFVGLELPKWNVGGWLDSVNGWFDSVGSWFSSKASAADTFTEGYYKYTVTNEEATITMCNRSISGDVIIPDMLGGYPVTSIGYPAFLSCTSLTSVIIPDSVTSIEDHAFNGCEGLKRITIGNSVKSIGDFAFYGCTSLTSVIIPDSVTSIGDSAFKGCTRLTTITIPESAISIGVGAFHNTAWFDTQPDGDVYIGKFYYTYKGKMPASIVIKDGTKGISSTAFYGRDGLTSVEIPDSVTSIDALSFDCQTLTEIHVSPGNAFYTDENGVLFNKDKTNLIRYPIGKGGSEYSIPNSVTSIGNYAFENCWCLTSVEIPDSVTSIGNHAFEYCSNLASVTIPDGVTSIKSGTFSNCNFLSSVTIPDSVTSIGSSAFFYCVSLSTVSIPDGVTSIGYDAFAYCPFSSITLPDSVTSIGAGAFFQCWCLKSITIPDGVTSIGRSAFAACISLKSITIPDSVTSIGYGAFYDTAYYNDQSRWESGVLYIGNNLIEAKTSVSDVCDIKNGTRIIADRSFYECSGLTSITIPDSVISVGDLAFFRCTGLMEITVSPGNTVYHSEGNCLIETKTKTLILGCKSSIIPSDGSVTSIGREAFYECRNFNSITIPDSVTSIGYRAFDYTGIRTVYYGGSKSRWQAIKIETGNNSLTNATIIYNYGVKVGDDLEWEMDGSYLYISGYGTTINDFEPDGAPWYNYIDKIDGIYIFSDTIEEIGQYAFYGLENVNHVHIGSDVLKKIGKYAFFGLKEHTHFVFIGSESQWNNVKIDYGNDLIKRNGITCTKTDVKIPGENVENLTAAPMTPETYLSEHVKLAKESGMIDFTKDFSFSNKAVIKKQILWAYNFWDVLGDVGEIASLKFDDLTINADFYEMYVSDLILALNDSQKNGNLEANISKTYKQVYSVLKKVLKTSDEWNESATLDIQKDIEKQFTHSGYKMQDGTKKVLEKVFKDLYRNNKAGFESVFKGLSFANDVVETICTAANAVQLFIDSYNAYVVALALHDVNSEFFTVLEKAGLLLGYEHKEYSSYAKYFLNAVGEAKNSQLCDLDELYRIAAEEYFENGSTFVYNTLLRKIVEKSAYTAIGKLLNLANVGDVSKVVLTYRIAYGIIDAWTQNSNKSEKYKVMNYVTPIEMQLQSVTDQYRRTLLSNQTEENALKYDMAFNILKQTNLYLYTADYNYCSYVKDTNEMQKATCIKNVWEKTNCHYNDYSSDAKYSMFATYCPVDVYIYDTDGVLITSVVDDKIEEYNSEITIMNHGGEKTFIYPSEKEYRIVVKARESGTMEYSAASITGVEIQQQQTAYEIPLTENQEFTVTVPSDSTNADDYKLITDGEAVDFDYDSTSVCAEHSFGEWVKDGDGKSRICTACSYREFALDCEHSDTAEFFSVSPTCTEPGHTVYKCTVCGKEMSDGKDVLALGHTYGEYVVTTEPTCTESGVETKTCSVCGDEQIRPVAALGHTEVTDPAKHPTCTETGLTEGSHCSVCGEVLTAQEEIPALGHTDTNADGKCDNCGETMEAVKTCTCNCHKGGFAGFIYKIMRIFWKLFRIKKTCACGVAHY